MTFQGHVANGVVVFDEPSGLPEGTTVRIEPVAASAPDFWRPQSLNELASQQEIAAHPLVAPLADGWPDDERQDGFEEAMIQWRTEELEQAG